jgi:hypothetical protein
LKEGDRGRRSTVSETKPEPPSLETRLRTIAVQWRCEGLCEVIDGDVPEVSWEEMHTIARDAQEAAERIVSLHQQLAASTAMVEPLLRRAEAAEQDWQAAEARIATLEQHLRTLNRMLADEVAANDQEAGR